MYLVKTRLSHSGERYLPGSSVELSDADAAPLLKVQAIEPMPATESGKGSAPAVSSLPTAGAEPTAPVAPLQPTVRSSQKANAPKGKAGKSAKPSARKPKAAHADTGAQ